MLETLADTAYAVPLQEGNFRDQSNASAVSTVRNAEEREGCSC